MSVDHTERIKGLVKAALKEASMGEAFGLAVSGPSFWPFLGPDGKVIGQGPAWFIVVTIRSTGLGEPDVFNGFPVPGILPSDEDFRQCAQGLLEMCHRERDRANAIATQAVGPSMKLSERPR